MNNEFLNFIHTWPKAYIRDQDLATIFFMDDNRRYDTVKYAIRKGLLTQIKRGLYLINSPYKKPHYDPFEIAQTIHGPSYISLESALSYYGWIPEKVQTCTSVTSKRSKEFTTPIANFSYSHTPIESFMLQVTRVESPDSIFLIAEPWKAMADYIYVQNKSWQSLANMVSDLRIDEDCLLESSAEQLQDLTINYASTKVKKILIQFYRDLLNEYKNNRRSHS